MDELELKLKKSEEQAEEYECKNELFQVDIRSLKSSIRDCNVRLNQKDQIIQDLKSNIEML
jgi:chromosome segregation ATPase